MSTGSLCRLCKAAALERALCLPTAPDVYQCRACGHIQALEARDQTASSIKDAAEVQDLADFIMDRFRLPPGGQVIEIGSHDGALLRILQDKRCRVLGVEPARDVAHAAWESGVDTLPHAFSAELASETILEQRGPAVMVIAVDVFAGACDLSDILTGVRTLLTPGGLLLFETPSPAQAFEQMSAAMFSGRFLSYHTVRPLQPFLREHGFELIEATRTNQGGALRAVAKVQGGPWPIGPSVAAAIAAEDRLGLHTPEAFHTFSDRIRGEQ